VMDVFAIIGVCNASSLPASPQTESTANAGKQMKNLSQTENCEL
jgi:hypothetical protein